MSVDVLPGRRSRWLIDPRRLRLLGPVAIAALAAVVGAAFAMIGQHFGVGVLLALPIVAVLFAATLWRPAVGVGLTLLAIPIGLYSLPVVYVIQAVSLLPIIAVMLSRIGEGRLPLPWAKPIGWGIAVLAICLVSTPHAPQTTLAVNQDVDIVLGLLLVLAVYGAVDTIATVRRLAHVLLAVGCAIAILSFGHAGSLQSVAGGQAVDNRLHGTFTEPNQFGGFCGIVVIVAIGVALGARSRLERYLASAAALLVGVAMLLALSRGAWVGFGLAGILLLVLVPKARRALGVGLLVAMLVVPLADTFTPDNPQVKVVRQRVSTLRLPTNTVYDSRPAIWREALREIADQPIIGQGPGQFPVVSAQPASDAATVYADHAHNVLLTVAAEAGIPAALLLVGFTLSMLGLLVRTVRSLRGSPDAALIAGLGSALVVVIGQGLVDFTLRNADIFALLAVMVGLLLAAARAVHADRRDG